MDLGPFQSLLSEFPPVIKLHNLPRKSRSAQMPRQATQDHRSPRVQRLVSEYGELCDMRNVARLLCYPSHQALLRAHQTNRLPITLIRLPRRKGLFAATEQIAQYLDSVIPDADPQAPIGSGKMS
jgi:hypothetical protein